ncbi:MAG: hypothetical protein HW380_2692 [Magnetococcales bacterium]|nr:hypothetical protein [Magnetococcales bacterium]HIJ85412.1 hypothetical protein [Magnetococcales bacterium]
MTNPKESFSTPEVWLRILVQALLVIGLAVALLKITLAYSDKTLTLHHPEFLLPTFFLQGLVIALAATLWRRSLAIVSPLALERRQALAHVGIILVAKYVPGKLWGLVGRGLHARHLGITAGAITTATALEQLAIMSSAIMIMGAGLFHEHLPWLVPALAATILILCSTWKKSFDLLAKWAKGPLVRLLILIEQGSAHLCSKAFAGLCWLAFWQWILTSILLAEIVAATGATFSIDLVFALIIAAPAAIIAGFLVIFVPGGIGIREGVLVYYLEPVIGMEAAIMTAIVFRIVETLRDVVMGIWAAKMIRT